MDTRAGEESVDACMPAGTAAAGTEETGLSAAKVSLLLVVSAVTAYAITRKGQSAINLFVEVCGVPLAEIIGIFNEQVSPSMKQKTSHKHGKIVTLQHAIHRLI